MSRRPAYWAWVSVVASGSPLAQAQSPIDSINQYVGFELRRQRIPGASVAILRGDRVLLARGYGFANLELGVPASDSTIYQSGSLGKQFTAAAVLMLAEQGRLALDQKIVKWLPEGGGVWDSVTVRQLLTHTGGRWPEPSTGPEHVGAPTGLVSRPAQQRGRVCVRLRVGPDRAARTSTYWPHRVVAGLQDRSLPLP